MPISSRETHQVSALAGQGEVPKLVSLVRKLARREGTPTSAVLAACKDDFQQTAAHIAAKAGQIRKFTNMIAVRRARTTTS